MKAETPAGRDGRKADAHRVMRLTTVDAGTLLTFVPRRAPRDAPLTTHSGWA